MVLHKDFPQSPHAILDTAGVADYRSVIGYFAQNIMKDLRQTET